MKDKKKIIVILIAYNASKTLEKFYRDFPKNQVDEIILVDDASKDNTLELAKKLGIRFFKNPVNLGYGGNMKRAMAIGLYLKGDILIDIHPDGEYSPSCIPEAIERIKNGADFVLGNRFTSLGGPLKNGMYLWKYLPIAVLNWIDKIILGVDLDDLHQGFRVYTKNLLNNVSFEENSNNYLFSFELIAQAVNSRMKTEQVPVETNYAGKKRGASLKNSIKYSIGTFHVLILFILARLGLKTKLFKRPSLSLNERIDKLKGKI